MTDSATIDPPDDGKVVAAGWAHVRSKLPAELPDDAMRILQAMFYVGADVVFLRIISVLGTDGDAAQLDAIEAELRAFQVPDQLKGHPDGQAAR